MGITSFGLIPSDIYIYKIFSSMFLHGNWMHLIGNMAYLWIFGNNIEDYLGHIKFLIFYLFCGICATLIHVFSDANSSIPVVGASGWFTSHGELERDAYLGKRRGLLLPRRSAAPPPRGPRRGQ